MTCKQGRQPRRLGTALQNLAAAAVAFLIVTAISQVLAGCTLSTEDCNCAPLPPRPEPQTLPLSGVVAFDNDGESVHEPISWQSGTLEVSGEVVTLRYLSEGAEYLVTYDYE